MIIIKVSSSHYHAIITTFIPNSLFSQKFDDKTNQRDSTPHLMMNQNQTTTTTMLAFKSLLQGIGTIQPTNPLHTTTTNPILSSLLLIKLSK